MMRKWLRKIQINQLLRTSQFQCTFHEQPSGRAKTRGLNGTLICVEIYSIWRYECEVLSPSPSSAGHICVWFISLVTQPFACPTAHTQRSHSPHCPLPRGLALRSIFQCQLNFRRYLFIRKTHLFTLLKCTLSSGTANPVCDSIFKCHDDWATWLVRHDSRWFIKCNTYNSK